MAINDFIQQMQQEQHQQEYELTNSRPLAEKQIEQTLQLYAKEVFDSLCKRIATMIMKQNEQSVSFHIQIANGIRLRDDQGAYVSHRMVHANMGLSCEEQYGYGEGGHP